MRLRSKIEILGVIAVVLSLVFVAYELRQTRQAILGETYLQITTQISSSYISLMENESLVEAILASESAAKQNENNFKSLSLEHQFQLNTISAAKRFELDAYLYQYELGLLDDEFYEFVLEPEFRLWYPKLVVTGAWETDRLRPEFRKAVEDAQID